MTRRWLLPLVMLLMATAVFAQAKYVPKGTKTVTICPSGCMYTTLNAACAARTSTSANPLIYELGPGTYSGQISCSGEDHATFRGAGIGVTILDAPGVVGQDGTFKPGSSTNYTIENMTIKGHQTLRIDGATTGGGKIVIQNNEFATDGVAVGEDCLFLRFLAANTEIHLLNNRCNATEDGFTVGEDAANIRIYSYGNTIRRGSIAADATQELWRLGGIPALFISKDNIDISSSLASAQELYGYRFRGDATGSCASGCKAYIMGGVSRIENTSGAGVLHSSIYVFVDSTATELSDLQISGVDSLSMVTNATNGTSVGVALNNTTTNIAVIGSKIRTSGGATNYDLSSASGKAITYSSSDWVTSDPSRDLPTPIDQQSVLLSVGFTVNSTSDAGGVNAVILDNTNEGNAQYGPRITMKNATVAAGDDQWSFYVDPNGKLAFADDAGSEQVVWPQSGAMVFARDGQFNGDLFANKNAATVYIGNNTASDQNRIVFFTGGTNGVFRWNDTDKCFEMDNAEVIGLTNSVANPTLNSPGIAIDTTANQLLTYSGGAVRVLDPVIEFCYDQRGIAATDDNFVFFMADRAVTITSVGCRCVGTCSTPPTFTLEDNSGNAMTITGTNPTCATTTGNATYAAVTAANSLVAGEAVAFDVTNTPVATTDWVILCITYTVDRQ